MREMIWLGMLVGMVMGQQLPVYRASGRFLLDPCGDTVIIRGVELPVNYLEYIPEVAKTGANFVRVLISIPPAQYPTTAADLDSMLALTKRLGMGADVSLNNGTNNGSSFTSAQYMAVLKKYEDILTLHAAGEGQQSTAEQWVTESKAVIKLLRDNGYRCPLYILSKTSGRDPFPVLQRGQEIVNADPLKNILLGVQLYWGYTGTGSPGWYINDYKMTDKQAIDSFAVKNFPIVAGINNHDPYGDPWLDYETQLSECQAKRISWFWWDWYNPWSADKYHLSTTGKYGDWGVLAAGAPDMDKFTVSGDGSTTTYEAESYSALANMGWGPLSHSSVSGGKFLCCSGKRIPDWAEWNNVSGGSSGGQRTLTIRYSNGDKTFKKPLKVVLNGDTVGTFTCGYSGDGANDANFWRVWKDESISITLRSGANTLRIVSTATSGYFNPNYGERTVLSHPASIKNSSKRSRYMLNHSCTPVPVAQPAKPIPGYKDVLGVKGPFTVTVTDIAGRLIVRTVSIDRSSAAALLRALPAGTFMVTTIDASRRTRASMIIH